MLWYNQSIETEKQSTKILGKIQKCRFTICSKNNEKEHSRQVLIDYANVLNDVDATKTFKNMKKMV